MEVKKKTVQRAKCLASLRDRNRGREVEVLLEGQDVVYACTDREIRKWLQEVRNAKDIKQVRQKRCLRGLFSFNGFPININLILMVLEYTAHGKRTFVGLNRILQNSKQNKR